MCYFTYAEIKPEFIDMDLFNKIAKKENLGDLKIIYMWIVLSSLSIPLTVLALTASGLPTRWATRSG
jgi:hypothetical protein